MIQRQPTPLAQLFVVVFLSSLQVAEVLSRTADEAAAVYAEAEMFGLMLLRDRLQEVLAAGHLGWSKLPSDAAGLAYLYEELAATIPQEEAAAAKDFVRGRWKISEVFRFHVGGKRIKANSSSRLYHMKKGVRDHEMAGTLDVASLLQDIQSKQELVKILQQNHREFDDEVIQASQESAAETARVRLAMIKQRQLKDDTFKELQRLRAEMQRPDGAKNARRRRRLSLEELGAANLGCLKPWT